MTTQYITTSNGTRWYGTPSGIVTARDVTTTDVSTESVLHVIRHMHRIDSAVRNRLLGKPAHGEHNAPCVDGAYIAAQLAATGSKFHRAIQDPYALISFCIQKLFNAAERGEEITWMLQMSGKEFVATLETQATEQDKEYFGISPDEWFGTASVVLITPELASRVKLQQRGRGETKDHILINVVSGIPVPQTDRLLITIRKKVGDDCPRFFTAYTGVPTPSIPRLEQQSAEEYAYNKAWWDGYAFVRE